MQQNVWKKEKNENELEQRKKIGKVKIVYSSHVKCLFSISFDSFHLTIEARYESFEFLNI